MVRCWAFATKVRAGPATCKGTGRNATCCWGGSTILFQASRTTTRPSRSRMWRPTNVRLPDQAAATAAFTITRVAADGGSSVHQDDVAVEEPLEVRVGEESLATTMRTPGHDEDLVAGLLWAEGLIETPADILSIALIPRDAASPLGGNATATATLRHDAQREAAFMKAKRGTLTSAACGVSGRGALYDLLLKLHRVHPRSELNLSRLASLTSVLQPAQLVFQRTGG